MPKTPGKKKGKTPTAAASAKRKAARANQVPFFSSLPPTPPPKNKCRRISEDEDEPTTKKSKPSNESVVHRDAADPGGGNLAQHSAGRPGSGGGHLPSPRPSSPPPPEPRPSSRRNASPHPPPISTSSQHLPSDSTSRHSTARYAAPDGTTQHAARQHDTAPPNADQSQSGRSSGHSTSNAGAPRPPPSSPGRAFAARLQVMKEFYSQAEDLDDLELGEDDIGTGRRKPKGKKTVTDQEDEEDEEEEDEDADEEDEEEDDRLGNDDDDEELTVEAVNELMTVICSRKKQKYSLTKNQSNPEHLPGHFKKWGRHTHRLLGVYTNIFKTITTGMMVLKTRPSTPEEYTHSYKAIPNTSAAAAKFYTHKFMYLCDVVPKLKALCGHLLYRSGDMFVFAKFFKKHAGAGRSSDISMLKRNFAAYLPRVTVSEDVVIRPLTQVEYANRSRNGGYFSVCTGRLVLPIHKRADFDADPMDYNKQMSNEHKSYMRQKKRHKTDRTTEDDKSYPGFLYPSHLDYDETAPQQGIFKNTLCESVLRHLFKGPSAVGLKDGASNLGRTCLADIYNITKLTPDYLAYAATLIRHLLSVDGRWSGDDKRRSGHRFHTSLHRLLTLDYEMWEEDIESGELFEEAMMSWMDENIFSYYNRILFGAEEGDPEEQAADPSDYSDDEEEDDYDNLRIRVLNARRAELEDIRWQRIERSRRPQFSPCPEPQQPRAQSVDYLNAELPLDSVPSRIPGGAKANPEAAAAEADDEAADDEAADDEADDDADDVADSSA